MEKQLTLQNKIEQISLLVDFVNQICEELHLDETLNFNLNLVLEEAVTNVIMYAYPQDEAHTLTLKAWTEEGGKLAIELCDQGKPFNPIEEAPEVDTTLSAEERQIGGLGIFLIKQMMDEVNYEYKDHSNVLTLKKNINS